MKDRTEKCCQKEDTHSKIHLSTPSEAVRDKDYGKFFLYFGANRGRGQVYPEGRLDTFSTTILAANACKWRCQEC